MNPRAFPLALMLCLAPAVGWPSAYGQGVPAVAEPQIEFVQGRVEVLRAGSKIWDLASAQTGYNILHPGDELRTGTDGRAGLRLPDEKATAILDAEGIIFIPPKQPGGPGFVLKLGRLLNLHRGPASDQSFQTPLVSAIIRGTDFALAVAADGTTMLSVLDGRVEMHNVFGGLEIKSGEQAIVRPGLPPHPLPAITTVDVIQWCLYYPAVLDTKELPLTDSEGDALKSSLANYARGNLYAARAALPADWRQRSPAEQLYGAALLLGTGDVDEAGPWLEQLAGDKTRTGSIGVVHQLSNALLRMIATVKLQPVAAKDLAGAGKGLATEYLAESYHQQFLGRLSEALDAAKQAIQTDPVFGYAWERVAELEFGFGHLAAARAALDQSLALAPENAQGAALKGFVLSGENRIGAATTQFNRAIQLDPGLANGWLGRGLCEFRLGNSTVGLDDLQMAATVEPQRSLLRSYLGKAFAEEGNEKRANREMDLAIKADPRDPTGWLYMALVEQQENRINESISDLQESQSLNDNRQLFRSRLLLDQDRAVEGANLASVYRDAGMTDVSVREAASAVNDDYLNSSAHLFLSDAYNDLRDPTQFNLRYETVWFNELLLANLLSPVGGGRLSQTVSQQEYSKLFQQDGLGMANSTDVRSDGMYHQQSSQFGTFGNTEYALDLNYQHNNGVRVNNGLDDLEWDTTIKQQVTPRDTALFLMQYQNYHSGDNFQYYYQTNAGPKYEFAEYQHPILVGGWDHEWSPGIHTLALVSRLTDAQNVSDQAAPQEVLLEKTGGIVTGMAHEPYDVNYQNHFTIYSSELNQICELDSLTFSTGLRFQNGSFSAQDRLNNPPLASLYPNTNNALDEPFYRGTGYGYLTLRPFEHLWLTGGFAYDEVVYPGNYRQPPLSSGTADRSQLGPKAAVVWNPINQLTLRGVYTRSLGGVSLDESYRLEPTELAGFPQAFRSLISESLVGSVSAPTYETIGASLDLKFGNQAYGGIQFQRVATDLTRQDGDFVVLNGATASSTPETLNYKEYDFSANLDRLVGDEVVLGTSYSIIRSHLNDVYTAVSSALPGMGSLDGKSILQQAKGFAQFSHPSGFFARTEVCWYGQVNSGWNPAEPGVGFVQGNIFAGFYFCHHRAKLQLGILNLGGGNYSLNPLTPYQELPRSRVYEASVNFLF